MNYVKSHQRVTSLLWLLLALPFLGGALSNTRPDLAVIEANASARSLSTTSIQTLSRSAAQQPAEKSLYAYLPTPSEQAFTVNKNLPIDQTVANAAL